MSMKLGIRQSASILLRIFSYMGAKRKLFIIGWLLSLTELATAFVTPFLYRVLADIVTLDQGAESGATVAVLSVILIGLTPVVVLSVWLKRACAAYGSGELRKTVFRQVQRLPVSEIKAMSQGDYLVRLTEDATWAANVFAGPALTGLFHFVFFVSISFGVFVWIGDLRFVALAFLFTIATVIMSVVLNPKIRYADMEARAKAAESTSFLMETVRAAPIIRIFLLGLVFTKRYSDIADIVARKRMRFQILGGISESFVFGGVSAFAQPAGFILGVILVMQGELEIGQALFLAGVMNVMTEGLRGFSHFCRQIQPSLVAGKRVFEILDKSVEEARSEEEDDLESSSDVAVNFKDVCFSYKPEQVVLSNLTLSINKGEFIALVGESGSGKSTITKLIQRLYTQDKGDIEIFGSQTWSKNMISVVPQGYAVYDCSIFDNIAFGKQNAAMSKEVVYEAAKKAQAHDFIIALPDGYDTIVGEGGSKLSGGQRQRIAFARAILKDAPILLLDEATSALDVDTEQQIQTILEKSFEGKTIITVAHRLSLAQKADRILVVEKGQVVEEGTHDDLLSQKGRYADLCMREI